MMDHKRRGWITKEGDGSQKKEVDWKRRRWASRAGKRVTDTPHG